jgi:Holliday junction resolvase RusA-like endonuclease
MSITWTEAELKERLEKNPALRINERYSQPVKKRKPAAPKIPKIATLPPMRFYLQELPVKLFLPFVYPSLNKWTRMHWAEKKHIEDEFRDEVRWEIIRNQILGFRSRVSIQVTIYHPVNRHRDSDNFCYKWLKDALKGIVIIDDDPRYVEDLPVQFAKGKKHMDVWIRPI